MLSDTDGQLGFEPALVLDLPREWWSLARGAPFESIRRLSCNHQVVCSAIWGVYCFGAVLHRCDGIAL